MLPISILHLEAGFSAVSPLARQVSRLRAFHRRVTHFLIQCRRRTGSVLWLTSPAFYYKNNWKLVTCIKVQVLPVP